MLHVILEMASTFGERLVREEDMTYVVQTLLLCLRHPTLPLEQRLLLAEWLQYLPTLQVCVHWFGECWSLGRTNISKKCYNCLSFHMIYIQLAPGDVAVISDMSFSISFWRMISWTLNVMNIKCKMSHRWMFIKDESVLAKVMAWCCQATNYHLKHCWPHSVPLYGISRGQWVEWKLGWFIKYSFRKSHGSYFHCGTRISMLF